MILFAIRLYSFPNCGEEAAFGRAPALVAIFDTISEFNAATGICGFGIDFVDGGGRVGFTAAGAGLAVGGAGF